MGEPHANAPADLLDIIARAASPAERADDACFEPRVDPSSPEVIRRVRTWIATATGHPHMPLEQFAELRGVSPARFVRGVCDVRVRDPAKLPAWARTFLTLVAELDGGTAEGGLTAADWQAIGGDSPINDVVRPFLDLAMRWIGAQVGETGPALSKRAMLDLAGVLGRRLAGALVHVIDSELQARQAAAAIFGTSASTARLDGSASGWRKRFARYPVLAYLVAVTFQNWQAFSAELVARLHADRQLLEQRMFAGAALGRLESLKGDAGDVHDEGRAVVLLRFEDGRRLVYKPKDLRISAGFIDLVAHLNAFTELPLHTRVILPRGAYAWEAWVEHKPCRTGAEVSDFYRRLGATLRLLQLLGARDFWLDNLVAAGEDPVFIDLEMVVQQAPELPEIGVLRAEVDALAWLQETIVSMGVVAMGTPIGRSIQAEDLGALTPVRPFKTPFKSRYSPALRSLITPGVDFDQTISWTKTDYAPVLDDRPAVPSDHFEQVLAGYRSMQRALIEQRESLLAEDGPLLRLSAFPVRHIVRDTWSYIGITNESARTPLLVDAVQREIFFEGLLRPAFHRDEADRLHVRKVLSEIESLRQLDVSLFQSLPGERTLLSTDGTRFPGYFERPAMVRILERVRELREFPLERHVEVIRSCFATGRHPPLALPPAPGQPPPDAPLWLDEATRVADGILADAFTDSSGGLAWVGLVYHPDVDMLAVDVLRTEILCGSCGLALVLADLYTLSELPRFRTAALGALASILQPGSVERMRATMLRSAALPNGALLMCGALYGNGAHIYTLHRVARAIGAPELDAAAMEFVRSLPMEAFFEYSPRDIHCGLPGLAIALAAAAPEHAQPVVARLLDDFRDAAVPPRAAPYPPEARILNELPDPRCSALIALDRAAKVAGAVPAGREAELFDTIEALRSAVARSTPSFAGLLAQLLNAPSGEAKPLRAAIDASLTFAVTELEGVRLLSAAELALAAARRFPGTGYEALAARFAGELLRRRVAHGTAFPEHRAAERHHLSAIHGLGAVLHLFCRLASLSTRTVIGSLRIAE